MKRSPSNALAPIPTVTTVGAGTMRGSERVSPNSHIHRAVLVAVTLIALPWVQGCATNEENLSERPWNTPRSWETGLPSSMTEERR